MPTVDAIVPQPAGGFGAPPPPPPPPPPHRDDEGPLPPPTTTMTVPPPAIASPPARVEEEENDETTGTPGLPRPATPPTAAAIPPTSIAGPSQINGTAAAVPTTKKKSPRPRMGPKAKSAVSQLELETKCLLGRISAKGLKTARRAAHRTPTLEELRGMGFEEYVRREVLGVPLDYLEEVKAQQQRNNGGNRNKGGNVGVVGDVTGTGGKGAVTSNGSPDLNGTTPAAAGQGDGGAGANGMAAAQTTAAADGKTSPPSPPPPPPAPTRQSSRIRERRKSQPIALDDDYVYDATGVRSRTRTPPPSAAPRPSPPTPSRTSSRIRERRKHGILAGESPDVLVGLGVPADKAAAGGGANGNGTTRPRSLVFGGGQNSNSKKSGKKKPPPARVRLYPDPVCMADGVCKITLPDGWWDRGGICNDTTARGPMWKPGTRLGDLVVTTPIKQCAGGIGGVFDFAMLEMPPMTVSQFREKADGYRKAQVGKEVEDDMSDEALDNLARKFWRRLGPTMEPAYYGADHEGTLFCGDDASGWNVDKLESCLSLLRADAANGDADEHIRLPGVTSAYLYFGMWASTFAAHTEDMGLLSINYLHAGAPKYWYAISPDDSARFESLMVSNFPAAARDCPEFLRHKRYLLSPAQLTKAGIKYTTCVQRPGDAIITIPGAYHFGFNTGFNVAESTNFAVPEWVPIGDSASVCLCHPHSVRIDMKRFKHLLRRYEEDVDAMELEGLDVGTVTYSEWAKYEARRIKRARQMAESANEAEDEAANGTGSGEGGGEGGQRKKQKKGLIVEVLRLETRKNPEDDRRPKKKARKAKAAEDWRLALRARPSVFLVAGTPVLCFVRAEDNPSNAAPKKSKAAAVADAARGGYDPSPTERCFSGTVVDAAEGHVRVHFAGSAKKADVWLPADSDKLFLDGGPESPPSADGGASGGKGK